MREVGIDETHAEAIVNTVRDATLVSHDDMATKGDVTTAVAVLRSDLYRALWLQGAGIVAVLTALRFIPI